MLRMKQDQQQKHCAWNKEANTQKATITKTTKTQQQKQKKKNKHC